MSKLTDAEKDKLDNTCGNLRITKLGTHVKSLEDFVNEGILKTRANDVTAAINELWDMITNKDCESITIPPPGFFTLFGDDQTGKLYVYYNNADYPPQFRHVETPGELEGTLYLYIADPVGENHYELEVGHYIAVKHLDNYYTKDQVRSMFTVTVEKQTTAESGSFATYVVKQGGNQVGSKINIPKDYLVKSCSVKTCTTANVPVQGYKVGDKYIDWVINTRDGSATNEHLYLLVNEIVDPYKPDDTTITLSSGNVFSVKDGGITLVKLAPAVQTLINGKADANHAHGNITKEGKVGTTANVPLITGSDGVVQAGSFGSGANNFARGNHGHSDLASIAYVDNQIASVEGDVVIDLASKADAIHSHDLNDINVTTITSVTDYNTLKTRNMYKIFYSIGKDCSNRPTDGGGLLVVENIANGVCQTFHQYGNGSTNIWYRTFYEGGDWSDWKKIVFEGHTHEYLPLAGGTLTGAVSSNSNITTSGTVQGATIKKTNGTSEQFLKADGSVDGSTYVKTDDGRLSDDRKPKSHQSADGSVYGYGTTSHFGHCKVVHNLDDVASLQNGEVLSAYRGKLIANALDLKENAANKVTAWSSTTNNSNYPGEKLVKDSLDGKAPTKHQSADGSVYGYGTTSHFGHCKVVHNLDDVASLQNGEVLSAYRGKLIDNKINAITSDNSSVQTFSTLLNNYTGIIKYKIKNGWCIITFENLKCTSTQDSFVQILALSVGHDLGNNTYVYWNYYPSNSGNAVSVRINNSGILAARCFTANQPVSGHMTFPCIVL